MNRKLVVQLLTCMTVFLFIFTILSSTVQSVPPVSSRTLIVDINGDGDYTSIQDAIDNATSNDIIRIREGLYEENNLQINKKIEITGDDPSNTVIDCSWQTGFTLQSSYVDISNLKLVNPGDYAIYVAPESYGCTISNCIILKSTSSGIGIWVRAPSVMVSECDISGYNLNGIGIKLRESSHIIRDCNIQGFVTGVSALVNTHDNQILDCNLFNNENAIEIKINSNNNRISGCNIYSNKKGVYIWQDSNDNSIYLNNFWKNDIDAADECNNTWDNGIQGNYWDDYREADANGDGIGDAPYTISSGNTDDYPLITMILPDEITSPGSVSRVTSNSDNTPSFSWNPSVYGKGIKGYYVKIDGNPEIYVSDTTSWTSSDALLDGVHTFYVRAKGTDNTTSSYSSITFTIDTVFIDADEDGWSDEEEQEYGTDPNDPDNYPLDTDNDHIPDSVDTDDDNDGYRDDMELSYGTDTKNSNDYPTDTDGDGIPDEDPLDGKYTGDVDDDNDGLTDIIETKLGSNPLDGSDTKKIYLDGTPYYLIDVSQNGLYDVLYEIISDTTTAVEKHNENYLIDENGDGTWDYIYYTADGSISAYEEQQITLTLAIWIVFTLVILGIAFIILYYVRNKPGKYKISRKVKKIVERPSIKKPLRVNATNKKDTAEMIGQTRTLLQHIQQDVEVYMEKLSQMEDQITVIPLEKGDKITTQEEKQDILKDIHSIESEVDELLFRLNDKNKD